MSKWERNRLEFLNDAHFNKAFWLVKIVFFKKKSEKYYSKKWTFFFFWRIYCLHGIIWDSHKLSSREKKQTHTIGWPSKTMPFEISFPKQPDESGVTNLPEVIVKERHIIQSIWVFPFVVQTVEDDHLRGTFRGNLQPTLQTSHFFNQNYVASRKCVGQFYTHLYI